jgi:hypothetical protein
MVIMKETPLTGALISSKQWVGYHFDRLPDEQTATRNDPTTFDINQSPGWLSGLP